MIPELLLLLLLPLLTGNMLLRWRPRGGMRKYLPVGHPIAGCTSAGRTCNNIRAVAIMAVCIARAVRRPPGQRGVLRPFPPTGVID